MTVARWALLGGYQRTGWLRDGQTCAVLWLCVGKGRPGRNDARGKSRSVGFSPGTNVALPLKSSVFFKGWGRAGMLGLRLWGLRLLITDYWSLITGVRLGGSLALPRGGVRLLITDH